MCYTVKDHGKKYISFLEDTLIPKRKDKSRLVKFSLFSFFSVIIVFMFNVFVLLSSKTITHWKSNISYIFRRYFSLKILKVDNNSKQSFVNQNAQLEKRMNILYSEIKLFLFRISREFRFYVPFYKQLSVHILLISLI